MSNPDILFDTIESMKALYTIRGKVRSGEKRGRILGFPTANIALHRIIPSGIYISKVKLQGRIYPALTFIGEAKTFEETLFQSETYILDFKKNIYGQWASIQLVQKIRENQKFTTVDKLISEMKSDEKVARTFFSL